MKARIVLTGLCALVLCITAAVAENEHGGCLPPTEEDVSRGIKAPSYSPYAGRNFPTKVLWGDTHLHTSLSLDARAFGVTLGPAEAFKFARGDEVVASHGERVRLSRPLDFLVVTDHSDAMGAMNEIIKGNPKLMRDPKCRDWHDRIAQGGKTALMTTMEIIQTFAGVSGESIPEILMDRDVVKTIWEQYLDACEEYNEPGRFTSVIGYEWTSTEGGLNLHRNVLYRGNAGTARMMLPYTTAESYNPEDLWKWMARYEDKTGGRVLALAHNGGDRQADHQGICRGTCAVGADLRGHADQGRRRNAPLPFAG
jgi:hypothetical protein